MRNAVRALLGIVSLTLLAPLAQACPPLQALAGWRADAPELKDYDQVELRAGADYAKVAGKVCRQSFHIDGAAPDDAQVQAAYRAQLRKLGAETLLEIEGQTTARLVSGGAERWLVVYSQPGEVSVVAVDKQLPQRVLTAPAGNDYRLLGHMPDYVAAAPRVEDPGKLDFHVEDPAGDNDVAVSGRAVHIQYTLKPGAKGNSDADVAYNYRARLQELGAQFLSVSDDGRTTARIEEQGRAIWFGIYNQPGEIWVRVVEEKPVELKPAATPASALKQDLDKDGRVALYINFDFNKATLRPDANAVLDQVAALLQAEAALRLTIEGHTDGVGTREYNQKLSQQRAESVVQALVRRGIAADRLGAAGFGASRPLAGNDTAEGRARNRRVELVKQ